MSALIGPAESLCRSAACRSALRLARLHDLVEAFPRLSSRDRPFGTSRHAAFFSSTYAIEGRPANCGGVRFCCGRLCPDRARP